MRAGSRGRVFIPFCAMTAILDDQTAALLGAAETLGAGLQNCPFPSDFCQFKFKHTDINCCQNFSLMRGFSVCTAFFLRPSFFFWFPLLGEDFPMWMVPISICTSDDPTSAKMQVLMDKPELTLVLKDVKPDQWVKVSGHKGAVSLVVTLMFSFIPASSSLSFSLQTCISRAGASLCYCWILAPVCNA